MKKLIFLVSISLCIVNCGRKSLPKPPETIAPAAVDLFQIVGKVDGLELHWRAPTKDASGGDLIDLESFVIQRSNYVKGNSADFDDVAIVPADSGTVIVSTDTQEKKKSATEFVYLDKDRLVPGKQYEYVVVGKNTDHVDGVAPYILRATFLGEASVVERVGIKKRNKED